MTIITVIAPAIEEAATPAIKVLRSFTLGFGGPSYQPARPLPGIDLPTRVTIQTDRKFILDEVDRERLKRIKIRSK